MTTEKNLGGRKPTRKPWDTKFIHAFRTDFAADSDVHVLLFMAGDHASQLIQMALRAFANSNGIPVADPDFQESVCLQAGTVIAKTKRSPCATEVMHALGQSAILKTLIHVIESGGQSINNAAFQPKPKPQAPVLPAPKLVPVAPSPIAIEITPEPVVVVAAPVEVVPPKVAPVDVPRPKKATVNIDIDIGGGEPVGNDVAALKNRWMSAHDY